MTSFRIVACATAFLASAALIPGPVPGPARADDTPALFATFKTFCVDTDTKPEGVEAAVAAAHGTPINPLSPEENDGTPTNHDKSWKITVGDHTVLIDSDISLKPGDSDRPATIMSLCSVVNDAEDQDAVAAGRNWIGLAPHKVTEHAELFNFMITDDHRFELPPTEFADRMKVIKADRFGIFAIGHLTANHTAFVLTRIHPVPDAAP